MYWQCKNSSNYINDKYMIFMITTVKNWCYYEVRGLRVHKSTHSMYLSIQTWSPSFSTFFFPKTLSWRLRFGHPWELTLIRFILWHQLPEFKVSFIRTSTYRHFDRYLNVPAESTDLHQLDDKTSFISSQWVMPIAAVASVLMCTNPSKSKSLRSDCNPISLCCCPDKC